MVEQYNKYFQRPLRIDSRSIMIEVSNIFFRPGGILGGRLCSPDFRDVRVLLGGRTHLPPRFWQINYRAVVSGDVGGALAPPEFGSLLTLFQPEGADCAHHITARTPGFENLTTALQRLLKDINDKTNKMGDF